VLGKAIVLGKASSLGLSESTAWAKLEVEGQEVAGAGQNERLEDEIVSTPPREDAMLEGTGSGSAPAAAKQSDIAHSHLYKPHEMMDLSQELDVGAYATLHTSGEKIKKRVGQRMSKGNPFWATFGTVLTAELSESGIQERFNSAPGAAGTRKKPGRSISLCQWQLQSTSRRTRTGRSARPGRRQSQSLCLGDDHKEGVAQAR
jgi:hypothetical protein